MVYHLFYKEWIKTRWFVIVSLVLGLSVVAYDYISLNSAIVNSGGKAQFAYNWLSVGAMPHYYILRNIPAVIALLVGVSQYYPEVLGKRIKLTLHLPVRSTTILYLMVLYGFLTILAIYLVILGVFFLPHWIIFPAEINSMAFTAITTWMVGGMAIYFFVAMIAMEPVWKFRFIYIIAVYGILDVFLDAADGANYLFVIALLVISSLSMLYTANRFKIGEN